jgi:pilus assembly protein CpaE
VARESFDVIVVDTSPFFHGPMLATLDRTDELLLLCSLDVPTLKNLRLALQTLDLLSFPKQRVRIVLNRSNSKVGMKPNEVEGALGMKVRFEVPSDRAVPLSVNRGNPVVLAEEGADVSKAIKAMAKELFPAVKEEGKKRRLLPTLAKNEGKRTLLLDLDLQFGDAAIMLGIEPDKTIYDLVVAPGELDTEKLAGYTTKHACGLEVLPAPLRPEDAELVTEAKLGRLLEVARESFDVIVVDTSPFFHGPMLATLDRTDELLLLCSLDVPTLKNLRLALQTLDLLSFPKQRVRIVLNRANSKVGMKPNEVEGALGMKVRFELPSDRAVPLSVNRGNPVVLAEEGADVSKAIKAMAKELFPAVKEHGKKRRLLPALARS